MAKQLLHGSSGPEPNVEICERRKDAKVNESKVDGLWRREIGPQPVERTYHCQGRQIAPIYAVYGRNK